jgi:hypothetical protein
MLLLLLRGCPVREPAAGFVRCGWVDRRIANFDVRDLAFFIHHVRYPIAHTVGTQDTVGFGHGASGEIAQQREGKVELLSKNFLGGSVVGTNAKYFCIVAFKFRNTSLVCREFLRSATGKSGREESHNHWILALEIGQRNFAAHGGAERKVGCDIADLERLRVARLLGHECRAGRECQRGDCEMPHWENSFLNHPTI